MLLSQEIAIMIIERTGNASRCVSLRFHNICNSSQSPPKSVFASVITVPPPSKRTELDHPAPSRLVVNAMTEAVKSVPSRSDDMIDDTTNNRTYRTGKRTGSVFDRLGQNSQSDRAHDRGDRDSRGREKNYERRDRHDNSRGERTDSRGRDRFSNRPERNSPRDEPVTFTITLNGAEEQERKTSNKRQSMVCLQCV